MLSKKIRRNRIHKKIRSKVFGTKDRPRLCIFRSQNHIYAQLINDDSAKVIMSVSDKELGLKNVKKIKDNVEQFKKININIGGSPKERLVKITRKVKDAFEVGKLVANKAIEKKIEKVVFDRGGFVFHGRIKAVADGAREGGLKF